MATTLNVNLSTGFQTYVQSLPNGGQGLYVYAVTFDQSGMVGSPQTIVDGLTANPTVHGSTSIALPSSLNGGKVYFIIQSVTAGQASGLFGSGGAISQESDIKWGTAAAHDFRYDSFEVSLLGQAGDAGNLTDVEVFGIPMSISVAYPNGAATQTRGYNVSAETIFTKIGEINDGALVHKYTAGPLANEHRLAAAPATALAPGGPGGASANDWNAYIEALGVTKAGGVSIAGYFNGAPSVDWMVYGGHNVQYSEYHNPGIYSYTLKYVQEPLTLHTASSANLASNPFKPQSGQSVITVTDPNAHLYQAGSTVVTFANVSDVGGIAASALNGPQTVTAILDASHYQFTVSGQTATSSVAGGGSAITSTVPLNGNPFSAHAGDMFFTVTDPFAGGYAAEGVQVTFDDATTFAGYSAQYLNNTTFTITELVDATHYRVGTSTAAQADTGGGPAVEPTYVRPNAGTYEFTPASNSQIQGTIKITSQDLASSIYSTLGNASIENPDGSLYQFSRLDTQGAVVTDSKMGTGANNEWGAFFVKLLTGFVGGYLGGTNTPLNPLLGTGPVDLSHNWNFDPTFAFGGKIAAGQQGAVTPFTWDQSTYGSGVPYDRYAEIFFDSTNSYGNGYSDALMSLFQQGGPLIATGYNAALASNPFTTTNGSAIVTVADPNAGTYAAGDLVTFGGVPGFAGVNMDQTFAITTVGTNSYTVTLPGGQTANAGTSGGGNAVVAQMNVPTINLTLFDGTNGYTPTEIYNTYDSNLGALVAPLTSTGAPNLSLVLNMGVGQMRIDPGESISLKFYTGTSGGLATFTEVPIPGQQDLSSPIGANPFFSTVSSNIITVQDPNAGSYAKPGASVTFSGATGFAGIDASALNKQFTIKSVLPNGQYTIEIGTEANAQSNGGGTSVMGTAYQPLYQTWVFDQGTNTFTSGGAVPQNGSTINLNGLPYDTGVNWYQLTIGTGPHSRTYNMYMDAVAGSGILNPQFGGTNPAGSIALDNLAALPTAPLTGQYLTSVPIGLFSGGTVSLDPALLQLITDPTVMAAVSNAAAWPAPNAPVLGTVSGPPGPDAIFTNWTTGGTTPSYNLNTPNSGLGAVTTADLSFGWWGADQQWVGYNAYNGGGTAIQVIGGYTNKVSGLDVAQITFSSNGFTAHTSISAGADIDGKWVVSGTFGNGTYSATMTEYLASDTGFTTPVANPSGALQFTVALSALPFANTGGGGYLQLDGSGGGGGSWIELATTGSSMPNATLLVFATDALGNMLDRAGNITTDLSAATLASIGSVAFDNGTVMQAGAQSVYLPVGQQLHFAVQGGNNAIEQLPGVQVTGTGALNISVSGGFGTLNLSARVDNTLSADEAMAGAQRDYNQPWVYLTQGQSVQVDVQGSAWNYNTIHFVHIDVNPSNGNWSVGGVAYGNTDAFRSAVATNWDPGFAATGGRGNFGGASDWTVSRGTGFYAPVLQTEGGDIFVIGAANVDGQSHIRTYGQNTFGFEDLRADQNSDFDYNDLVMRLSAA